jgi:YHS domain-containing protein
MVKDPVCGMELDEETANIKTEIKGKTYFFCSEFCLRNFFSTEHPTQRNLLSVILSKTFFELLAIGTGIGGIVYTLQEVSTRALVMDALSAIAAIVALIIGVENLRYLKAHDLLKRAILLVGVGIIISIALLVWHLGFHL